MTQGERRAKKVQIAQDTRRELAFRRARWNTRYVRTLRIVLPAAAVALVGLYGMNLAGNVLISQISDTEAGKITFETAEISADGFGMSNPRYEGFNPDGSRFVVTAKRAVTGLKADGPVRLETIDGQIYGLENAVTRLLATRGSFDQQSGKLTLDDGIVIQTSDGLTANLVSADVDTKAGTIASGDPVEVAMPTATVTGRRFRADQKSRVVNFDLGVVADLKPEQIAGPTQREADDQALDAATRPATAPAQRDGNFQIASDQPIRVTAKALEVRDGENRAVFSTNVVAVQSSGSLASDILTIHYSSPPEKPDGTPSQTALGGQADASGRKVEQLIAEHSVRLTQGQDTITAARAVFKPEASTADFSGGVEVASGEAQITAAALFVDQVQQTAALDGGVRVVQGRNTLDGHRLTIDQRREHMQLTGPPQGGLIATRFVRDPTTASTNPAQRANPSARGRQSPFAFETDAAAPIDVASRVLDVYDGRKLAIYTGDVTAKQGAFTIKAAKLTATYLGTAGLSGIAPGGARPAGAGGAAGAELRSLVAEGGVAITSSPTQRAKGDRATYDVVKEQLTLDGNVTVIDGRQILQGESLTIDMRTGVSSLKSGTGGSPVAEGGAKPGRMRAVFFPADLQNARDRRQPGATQPADSGGWSSQTSIPGQGRTN